ncbi:MAG: S41 family peptidase [Crocinitomicaceae bacterium]|nr:S41 family peptidase [Crocinitomicaceae bacterium]
MLRKFHLLLICLSLVALGNAQEDVFTEKYGPDQLKSDLNILVSDMKSSHPGLYEYTTPAIFDSLATVFETGLTDSLTQEQFHLRVRKFIRVVGCGHTSAQPSDPWYKALRGNASTVPMHIFLQDDQMYIRKAFDEKLDSLIGARVVSIDNRPANEVLAELKSIVGRDGFGETRVERNVQRLFQTFYLFCYGQRETYQLELEKSTGEMVNVTVEGKNPKRYSIQKRHQLTRVISAKHAKFGFIDSARKTAVIDLNSFPTGGYKKFYRKSFKQLAENNSETLIIDLRGNGGGYMPNGNRLLRYLMKEKFTLDFSKPRKQGKRSKHIKAGLPVRITRFIFATIPDRNKEDPDRNYQIRYKPIKKNAFNGKVYVLTDGWTFSTGSFVTSKLKNSGNAIVVGEETGGGEVAFNAVLTWKLSLPSSNLIVTLPMYHIEIQSEMEDIGRGVMPDIPVVYDNVQQKLDGIDLELEKILQSIETN